MSQKSTVSKPEKALRDLIRISNATGKDPALVQGGGGNTSVKTDDGKFMYIKASGTALKDMSPDRGWRRLRLQDVLKIIQDRQLTTIDQTTRENIIVARLMSSCDDDMPPQNRPSVESHLHAFLGLFTELRIGYLPAYQTHHITVAFGNGLLGQHRIIDTAHGRYRN